jgi:mRNA interferase HigB
MVIIKKSALNSFGTKHPDAIPALNEWYARVKAADWQNYADLKTMFLSADYIANERYVFNIKGNHYRIVARIRFSSRTVFIKFIGTHKSYDSIDPATIEQQ